MNQRSTISLPGSNDKILVTIHDITFGQVMTSLSWREGNVIVPTRSMRPNDRIAFAIRGHDYEIKLKGLTNFWIGMDTARFELSFVATESRQILSENEKIEKLISSLRDINDAKFVRNGEEHTIDEAIIHMRRKWELKKPQIRTAHDFITMAGSRSSITGKLYIIRYSDGYEMTSEEWFRKQLETIEKLPSK